MIDLEGRGGPGYLATPRLGAAAFGGSPVLRHQDRGAAGEILDEMVGGHTPAEVP
jgi:hypothetical protein